jgi:hypothetical protein
MAVTPEQALVSDGGMAVTYNRHKFLTVSLLIRLRNGGFYGGFRSETVTWIQ